MSADVELTSNSGNISSRIQHTPGIRIDNTREGEGSAPNARRDEGPLRGQSRRPGRGGRNANHGEGHTTRKPEGQSRAEGAKAARTGRGKNLQLKASGNETSTATSSDAVPNQSSQGITDSKGPKKRRGRGSKFNANLTEKPSGAHKEKEVSETYPIVALKQDDLTSTLIHSLQVRPYRDCLICFSAIRPFEPIWSCSTLAPSTSSSDDEKDGTSADTSAQCCWTPFHLKCINQWASKSVKDIADAWRARGEDKPGSWRCPGCQSKRLTVPNGYWCFCGSTVDPSPPRLATPHSCSANCSRMRVCGHPCPLSCHPGPCPPCQVTVNQPCFCKQEVLTFRCSFASNQARHDIASNFSCGKTCGKKLGCGNHLCQDTCHDGPCKPCPVTEIVKCYCGKEEKTLACGEGSAKESVIASGAKEIHWLGRFACENICESVYDCGIHRCQKTCHPRSAVTDVCPRSAFLVTRCPCSKHALTPSSAAFFPPGSKLERTACTDPIPTCESVCMKPLEGCSHVCSSTCHTGPCPPCSIMLVRPCRCGATTRDIRCSDELANSEREILCNQACTASRACGKHSCNRICCPLASLASVTKGKGRRKAASAPVLDVTDEAGWHECEIVCGKMLDCGNHQCEAKDHRGPCRPCLRYSYEEMICYCGRTILEPPIPCGTRIVCSHPCSRPEPPCGHPKAAHHCHEDPVACPPCVLLTRKKCACGKKMVDNMRCSQETVSCGTTCGRLLDCGFHHCERLCHSDGCGPCTAVCGKPRKICHPALHPCTLLCHAPAACSEAEPCFAIVNITCPCGRIVQPVPCGRSASNPGGRGGSLPLKCTAECSIAKRNAKLADALGISADRADTRSQVTYHDSLVAFARSNLNFCAMVEKSFSDFITSEKKTQILPYMPPTKRKFVHDLAVVYRMDTQMVDQEPKRSVELIRRIDTRIPSAILSSAIASTPASSVSSHSLGRLADLRSPTPPRLPGRSPNATPTPSASGSRTWTSVVARPQAPPAPKPAVSAHAWRPAQAAQPEHSQEPLHSLTVRPIRQPTPTAPTVPAPDQTGEDVPDNWEDEA